MLDRSGKNERIWPGWYIKNKGKFGILGRTMIPQCCLRPSLQNLWDVTLHSSRELRLSMEFSFLISCLWNKAVLMYRGGLHVITRPFEYTEGSRRGGLREEWMTPHSWSGRQKEGSWVEHARSPEARKSRETRSPLPPEGVQSPQHWGLSPVGPIRDFSSGFSPSRPWDPQVVQPPRLWELAVAARQGAVGSPTTHACRRRLEIPSGHWLPWKWGSEVCVWGQHWLSQTSLLEDTKRCHNHFYASVWTGIIAATWPSA